MIPVNIEVSKEYPSGRVYLKGEHEGKPLRDELCAKSATIYLHAEGVPTAHVELDGIGLAANVQDINGELFVLLYGKHYRLVDTNTHEVTPKGLPEAKDTIGFQYPGIPQGVALLSASPSGSMLRCICAGSEGFDSFGIHDPKCPVYLAASPTFTGVLTTPTPHAVDTVQLHHIKNLVQQWIDKQGHDKCWYCPEIFLEIAAAVGIDPKQAEGMHTITLADFQAGCCRYQAQLYCTCGAKDKSPGGHADNCPIHQ